MSKKQLEQYYATGRRKTSVARVFLRPGKGEFSIKTSKNKSYNLEQFFGDKTRWAQQVTQPLALLKVADKFNVYATVSGGGVTGQAEALCLAIARALDLVEQAKLTATVDFPTPPLPLAIAIILLTLPKACSLGWRGVFGNCVSLESAISTSEKSLPRIAFMLSITSCFLF